VVKTIKRISCQFPAEEPLPIQLPIKVAISKGDEVGSLYNFGDFDSYFNWQLARARLHERVSLLKKDARNRKLELLFEAKFNKPANYFRGIFAIDYKQVIPAKPKGSYVKVQTNKNGIRPIDNQTSTMGPLVTNI
jgi:hypothetical protein